MTDPPATCSIATPPTEALLAYKQLVVTFLKLQRKLEEVLEPHDLVISQFEALCKIGLKPGMIQQELVQHLLVTKGNVGALIDRLESTGRVERRADPHDRRANRLYLTSAAEAILGQILHKHRAFVNEAFKPLTNPQKKQLETLLRTIEP